VSERRALRRRSGWTALACLLAAAACSEPASGPLRIAWGRDACAHCGMAIGDPRYAAQVRTGPHDVARFDDFGCAVAWLAARGGAATAPEIWVMGEESGAWLDARRAFYRSGRRTPMAYGFGALPAPEPGALDFEAAWRALEEQERERLARRRP
jgi:hypothetical protein